MNSEALEKKHFIEAKNIYFKYDTEEQPDNSEGALSVSPASVRANALDNISITVDKGEYVCIVGRNGSGKSTFAKLLNLILEPDSGELYIDGRKITPDMSDEDILELRRRIGMVFQNPDNQLIGTVVEEDIAFGPENLGVPSEQIRERVDDALAAMGISDLAKSEPSRLSGGQKQRVAIAGILAIYPECIIFDESTAMLDPIGRRDVIDIMKKLSHEAGLTVINITHLMDEAAEADRVIVLNRGKLIADGTPEQIFSDRSVIAEAGIRLPQCAEFCVEMKKRGHDIGFALTPEKVAALVADKVAEVCK